MYTKGFTNEIFLFYSILFVRSDGEAQSGKKENKYLCTL